MQVVLLRQLTDRMGLFSAYGTTSIWKAAVNAFVPICSSLGGQAPPTSCPAFLDQLRPKGLRISVRGTKSRSPSCFQEGLRQ